MTRLEKLHEYVKELGHPLDVHIFHEDLWGHFEMFKNDELGEFFSFNYTNRDKQFQNYITGVHGDTLLDITKVDSNGFELTAFKIQTLSIDGKDAEVWLPVAMYLTCENVYWHVLKKRLEDADSPVKTYYEVFINEKNEECFVGNRVHRLY